MRLGDSSTKKPMALYLNANTASPRTDRARELMEGRSDIFLGFIQPIYITWSSHGVGYSGRNRVHKSNYRWGKSKDKQGARVYGPGARNGQELVLPQEIQGSFWDRQARLRILTGNARPPNLRPSRPPRSRQLDHQGCPPLIWPGTSHLRD